MCVLVRVYTHSHAQRDSHNTDTYTGTDRQTYTYTNINHTLFLLFKLLFKRFIYFLSECFAYMYVYTLCVILVPQEARRDHWIPFNMTYGWL